MGIFGKKNKEEKTKAENTQVQQTEAVKAPAQEAEPPKVAPAGGYRFETLQLHVGQEQPALFPVSSSIPPIRRRTLPPPVPKSGRTLTAKWIFLSPA